MNDDLRNESTRDNSTPEAPNQPASPSDFSSPLAHPTEFTAANDNGQYNAPPATSAPGVAPGLAPAEPVFTQEDAEVDWMALMGASNSTEETNTGRRAVLVFCRAPREGEVKTRLANEAGEKFAVGLYRAMLHDTFALCDRLDEDIEVVACHSPADAFETEPSLEEFWDGSTLAQYGTTLGERLQHAIDQLQQEGFERVAVLGSDAPDLTHDRVETALDMLSQYDVVVGPAEDNGFYLLATRRSLDRQFWSDVFDNRTTPFQGVMRACRSQRLRVRRLMPWPDVDTVRDVNLLAARLRVGTARAPFSRRFLRDNGLIRETV